MKNKGRFSLFIASVLLVAGLGAVAFGVLGSMGILPEQYYPVLEKISFYASLSNGNYGTAEAGALLIVMSAIIFAFRQRKPYSMFLPLFIPIIYETTMVLFRANKNIPLPEYLSQYANPAKLKLIALLLLLELILTIVLLSITKSMDARWRKRRDIFRRKLESEGIIPTKEEKEALKEKKRLDKELNAQKRKDDKAMARFEKERMKRENAEKKRIMRSQEKENKRYEKIREREERAKEAIEEKAREKAMRELDKIEERSKGEIRKLEKVSKREAKKKEKLAREKNRKLEKEKLEEPQPLNDYRGPANPNDPLSFPDFIDMPELKTFKEFEEKEPAPKFEESASILNTLAEEEIFEEEPTPAPIYEDITSKKKFKSGGMLEATLEMMNAPQNEVQRPSAPIRGYDDYESAPKVEEKQSFAPSNLSPNHPRYKMFQALKDNPPQHSVDVEEPPRRKADFAPSNLSPDHPRYRLFESLQHSSKSEGVTHYPTKAFEPEAESHIEPQMSTYRREFSRAPERSYDDRYERAPERYSDERFDRAPERYSEERFDRASEPYVERMSSSYAPPREERPVYREPEVQKPAPSYSRPYEEPSYEDIPEQTESLDLTAGIGGLSSNNAGYAAIMRREKQIYTAPPLSLLKDYPEISGDIDEVTRMRGEIIVDTYAQQRLKVELDNIIKGPTVTRYELKLAPGVLISKITARVDELSYALGGKSVRILAPIPGKQAVGIEVPNDKTAIVGFKDMIYSIRNNAKTMDMKVPMVLGKTITGDPVVIDVAKMPHMIIAGTTGSGKSVCINAFINTLIYQKGPRDVRLILVDPKVVELKPYNDIPHLLTPVITESKKVVKVLNFLVEEMERRYSMLSNCGVRNIEGYNQKLKDQHIAAERMPYIVLIMDEFADMMSVVGKDIETQIARLAAKARAAGIHMILATQRPSADVITGTIKSNLPARVAFAVSSGTNSRVILDEVGAENLLGKGDMLLMDPGFNGLQRIQGAFLSDLEVEAITSFARQTGGQPDYLDEVIFEDFDDKKNDLDEDDEASAFLDEDSDEALFERAKEICYERKSASASYLQRRMKIGYNRAARIVEMMEERGIVGPAQGSKPREILKYE